MSSIKNVNPVKFLDFASRLLAAVEKRGLNQITFSKLLEVPQGQVSAWFVGRSRPSKLVIRLIAKELQVSENWLRDGVGAMYESGPHDKGKVVERRELYGNLQSADRKALQKLYELLANEEDETRRQRIRKHIQFLLDSFKDE